MMSDVQDLRAVQEKHLGPHLKCMTACAAEDINCYQLSLYSGVLGWKW